MPSPQAQRDLTSDEADNLAVVRRYLQAVAQPHATLDNLAAFLHPDVIQEELPNLVVPSGIKRDWAALSVARAKGAQVITNQSYEILTSLCRGDRVALEVLWTGTLQVPYGPRPPGSVMRAHMAAFFQLRDGRIVHQRNYDCYQPYAEPAARS
jgi:ketosteroid isomerase-like protein